MCAMIARTNCTLQIGEYDEPTQPTRHYKIPLRYMVDMVLVQERILEMSKCSVPDCPTEAAENEEFCNWHLNW